jgi:hypothetical protein
MILALVWPLGLAAILRIDLAVVDFLVHTEDLSSIHGAVAESPATFVTPQGSTIDAASLQDLHDEDTALSHIARNHLMFVLSCIFLVPLAIGGLLAWTPKERSTGRKSRAKPG